MMYGGPESPSGHERETASEGELPSKIEQNLIHIRGLLKRLARETELPVEKREKLLELGLRLAYDCSKLTDELRPDPDE